MYLQFRSLNQIKKERKTDLRFRSYYEAIQQFLLLCCNDNDPPKNCLYTVICTPKYIFCHEFQRKQFCFSIKVSFVFRYLEEIKTNLPFYLPTSQLICQDAVNQCFP